MAKITQEQRLIYQQKIKYYKTKIDVIKKDINQLKIESVNNKNKEPLLYFKIANLILNLITYYCALNEISVYLMSVKNTTFLEKARQQLYETIIVIEKVVTNLVNVPFSEYSEYLIPLASVSDLERLNYIKKLGYCIDLVKENFGENTKWKWSFVEIEARFSVIAKNIFDLKRFQKLDDPHEEGFQDRKKMFSIIQRLLYDASLGYREKFELSTKDTEDLIKAIDFQSALLRLNQLTGDQEKIEKCKKHIEVWTNILDKKIEEIEEQKRNKQISKK